VRALVWDDPRCCCFCDWAGGKEGDVGLLLVLEGVFWREETSRASFQMSQ
jgi:hypothetical protein